MEKELYRICNNYINNRNELGRIFKSENPSMHLIGAAVLTAFEKDAEEKKLLESIKFLNSAESFDSPLRGLFKSVTAAQMTVSDDIETYHRDLVRAHGLIHVNTGSDNARNYIAAMMLIDRLSDIHSTMSVLDRASRIHSGLGRRFTASEERSSYIMAMYAALRGVVNVDRYLKEIKECKRLLKKHLKNNVVSVGDEMLMLLALAKGDTEEKCRRVGSLYKAIKTLGIKFEDPSEMTMLPILSELDMDDYEIADELCAADEFLIMRSDFNNGRKVVLKNVYAAMLVMLAYAPARASAPLKSEIADSRDVLGLLVLMAVQTVLHIQMSYSDKRSLHL